MVLWCRFSPRSSRKKDPPNGARGRRTRRASRLTPSLTLRITQVPIPHRAKLEVSQLTGCPRSWNNRAFLIPSLPKSRSLQHIWLGLETDCILIHHWWQSRSSTRTSGVTRSRRTAQLISTLISRRQVLSRKHLILIMKATLPRCISTNTLEINMITKETSCHLPSKVSKLNITAVTQLVFPG